MIRSPETGTREQNKMPINLKKVNQFYHKSDVTKVCFIKGSNQYFEVCLPTSNEKALKAQEFVKSFGFIISDIYTNQPIDFTEKNLEEINNILKSNLLFDLEEESNE